MLVYKLKTMIGLIKKILISCIMTLGSLSLVLVSAYGAIPPNNLNSSFSSFRSDSFPFHEDSEKAQEIKERLSNFYYWFKNQVHFSLMDGISEKSPQKVVSGLKNVRILVSTVGHVQTYNMITEEASSLLQRIKHLSNYLTVFEELSHQELINQNLYQKLHEEYITLLRDSSMYYSSYSFPDKVLETVVKDFVAQETATAFGGMILGPALVLLAVSAPLFVHGISDLGRINGKRNTYQENIKRCNEGHMSLIQASLYTDKEMEFYCSQSPEDIIFFNQRANDEYVFADTLSANGFDWLFDLQSYREEICSTVLELKSCVSEQEERLRRDLNEKISGDQET